MADFRELYKKYSAGECTDDERRYVEEEIEKARIVNDELFDGHRSVEFTRVTDEEVLSIKKKTTLKSVIRTAAISLASCIVLTAIVVGLIFGFAIKGANENINYTEDEARSEVAAYIEEYMANNHNGKRSNNQATSVSVSDRDLEIRTPLHSSYYVFEYDVYSGGYEFEVEFNPKTGECIITDIDRD